jgi:hypothetical protein
MTGRASITVLQKGEAVNHGGSVTESIGGEVQKAALKAAAAGIGRPTFL